MIDAGTRTYKLPTAVADLQWHHIAVAYDGESFTGFVDGTAVGAVMAAEPLATDTDGPFEAGIIASGDSQGHFDELAVYPGALTASELRGHLRADEGAVALDRGRGRRRRAHRRAGTIRRGRLNEYTIALENRGVAPIHGVTAVVRLPGRAHLPAPRPGRTERCTRILDLLASKGIAFDRAAMMNSLACRAPVAETTTAPEDVFVRVEHLGPGELNRIPLEVTAPTTGQFPVTLGLAPLTSTYSATGSNLAGDPVYGTAMGSMPQQVDPEEVDQDVEDMLNNAVGMPSACLSGQPQYCVWPWGPDGHFDTATFVFDVGAGSRSTAA